MSTIIPEMITVLSIKVIKSNLQTTDEFLNNPIKNVGVEIQLGQNTAFNLEKKNIRIRLNINMQGMLNETEKTGLSAEYCIEFHIHVDNLEQFLIEKEGNKIVDRKLGGTLIGIVYSSARGIILERTYSTYFKGVILPVIDPNLLLETKEEPKGIL